uniref:NADH dehydrogenase subunit 6 n=1 Tax=Tessmannella kiplingi TaxID=2943473 RepID=A0A9E8GE62_9HYME|nr:NADH dehydrogenase subunit 6 [Tessmannella kiplingi]
MKILINLYIILLFFMMMVLLMSMSLKDIHPLMLGFNLLMYSILISLSLNMFNINSLYSFMMYLIIIGGFLILFLYFNSFAINNKIIINFNLLVMLVFNFMLIIIMLVMFKYKFNMFNLIIFINNKLYESLDLFNSLKIMSYNINLLYMKMYNLTLFSMIYLLYSLLIITKMIYLYNPKSMRQLI